MMALFLRSQTDNRAQSKKIPKRSFGDFLIVTS